ncbi:hypothetical protein CDAR_3681 [Caerostris darwini]|uniref:Uncharacterized protein n=1 Tax=Caerostris darwini TaxID=1538125 RepID=A0AAV4PF67_9ARAC|nr:hypothetical protein CDAR_3681 [Caerostris darwini]
MSPCSLGNVALDDGKQKCAKLVTIIKEMEITDSQIALSRSATGLTSEFQRDALELLVKLEVKKNLQPWSLSYNAAEKKPSTDQIENVKNHRENLYKN